MFISVEGGRSGRFNAVFAETPPSLPWLLIRLSLALFPDKTHAVSLGIITVVVCSSGAKTYFGKSAEHCDFGFSDAVDGRRGQPHKIQGHVLLDEASRPPDLLWQET